MKKSIKKIISSILICVMIFAPASGVWACAADFSDINADSVFLKQHTSVTCTLTSTAMLMRRTAIIAGYSDWEEITEENIRSDGWVDGIGLLWNFTAYDITIGHGYFSGSDNKLSMLDLLDKYPQGVVIYNGGNSGQSHAVLLTDYDEKTDTFYCADPASSAPNGRIKLSETTIKGDTQDGQIANLTSYWFVSSPEVKLTAGTYTAVKKPSGSASSGEQSAYNSASDAAVFNSTKKSVNSYFVVTDDSSSGAALRYYPSGSSSASGYAQKDSILFIEYEGKNNYGAVWYKTSGGYYIFSSNLKKFSEYSAEITKFNNTAKTVGKTYAAVSDKVPLRIEPSEGNNIVAYINSGQRLYIAFSGVNTAGASWLQTSQGYYVKKSEMSFASDEKLADSVYTGSLISLSGKYNSSPLPDEPTVIETEPTEYITTASYLNMRKSPVDGEVLISIPKNTKVIVTAYLNGWGFTEYNGQQGWISLTYAQKQSQNVSEPLRLESVTADKTEAQVGDTVKCSVSVSENCFFLYSVYNEDGERIFSSPNYVTAREFEYKTDAAGIYYFCVEAKDSYGRTASCYSGNFTVSNKLQISSVMSDADDFAFVFDTITWTAEADSDSPNAVYKYTLRRGGEVIGDCVTGVGIFAFTPESAGVYTLEAVLCDDYSESKPVISAPVTVYDALNIDSIKLSKTSVAQGGSISCSVSASGGSGEYRYCFSLFKNGNLVISGSYSDKNEAEFSFDEIGNYSVFCAVTDSSNMIVSSFSADIFVIDFILGDVDRDGKITARDARMILRTSAGIDTLPDGAAASADVNSDGKVNAADARIVLRCAANIDNL